MAGCYNEPRDTSTPHLYCIASNYYKNQWCEMVDKIRTTPDARQGVVEMAAYQMAA